MSSKKDAVKEYGISSFKGAIGAIPFAGTFINEVVFEARSRIKQERINNFIEEFSQLMAQKGEITDIEKLNSEQIGDILENIFVSISQTSSDHKKYIFKQILLKQITEQSVDTDETIRFINITNELTELQFKILSAFYSLSDHMLKYKVHVIEHKDRIKKLSSWNEDFKNGIHTDKDIFEKNIKELNKLKKLVKRKESALKRGNINPNHHGTFNIKRESYIIEVQDLLSKGLLFDFALKSKLIEPYVHFGITELGRLYINYILE